MPHQDTRIIHSSGAWHVLAQRHEVMFRDGSTVNMHPVLQGEVPMPMHRAVHFEGLRWIIVDLRRHCSEIESDLKSSLERDAPGIVFYTLRQVYATARDFTTRVAMSHVHAWWQHDAAPQGVAA